MTPERFEIAGGSIIGKDHIFSRKPNQDAYCFGRRSDLIVGVVCDGCGDPSSPHSEVGAQIAARTIVSNLLACPRVDRDWLEITRQHTLQTIETLSLDMAGQDFGRRSEDDPRPKHHHILRDYFLFTTVGFAISPEKTIFFSIGDGTLFVNGQKINIGPFPNNAPPYMSYALMESSVLISDPGCLKFQTRWEGGTSCLHNFLIGCDGVEELIAAGPKLIPSGKGYVGDISQFWCDDNFFTNEFAIGRKLVLINKEYHKAVHCATNPHYLDHIETVSGLLHDDTTLVVGRVCK